MLFELNKSKELIDILIYYQVGFRIEFMGTWSLYGDMNPYDIQRSRA